MAGWRAARSCCLHDARAQWFVALQQFSNPRDQIRVRYEEEKRNNRKSRNKRSHTIAGSGCSVISGYSVFLLLMHATRSHACAKRCNQNRKDSDTTGMDRIDRIFQDSQDLTLVGNPVHPEKSCSSCLFFTVRMLLCSILILHSASVGDQVCHRATEPQRQRGGREGPLSFSSVAPWLRG